MLAEHPTLIWMDTSIVIKSNGFDRYFEIMEMGLVSSMQMPFLTGHSIRFATHPGMKDAFLNYSMLRLIDGNT